MRLSAGESILIAGTVVRRPEQKTAKNGTPYAKIRVRYGKLPGCNRYLQLDVTAIGALFPYSQKIKTGMRIMVAGKLSARDYIPQSGKYAGERRTYEEVMAEYLAVMPPVEQFTQEKEYHPEVAQWERNLYPDVTF